MSQTPRLHPSKDVPFHNSELRLANFIIMEDRLFEPMLVAGNSQVSLWAPLYVDVPRNVLPNHRHCEMLIDC